MIAAAGLRLLAIGGAAAAIVATRDDLPTPSPNRVPDRGGIEAERHESVVRVGSLDGRELRRVEVAIRCCQRQIGSARAERLEARSNSAVSFGTCGAMNFP